MGRRHGTPGEQDYVVNEAFLRDIYIPGIPRETTLVCFDVEHYDWAQPRDTTDKLKNITRIWRAERPEIRYGFYSITIERNYWDAISGDAGKIAAWQARNNARQELNNDCDLMFPSLYTFYDDQEGILEYMKRNLDEQRRLTLRKPVYPFVWPRYHNSNQTLGGQEIPASYWARIVNEVYAHGVDGVVFWDANSAVDWDDRGDWWEATEAYRLGKSVANCWNSGSAKPEPMQMRSGPSISLA